MFETEVLAGIAVLDDKGIDWRSAVLAPGLLISIPNDCVLGRTVGYGTAMTEWKVDDVWMEQHGFFISNKTLDDLYNTTEMDIDQAYGALHQAWQNAANNTPESVTAG